MFGAATGTLLSFNTAHRLSQPQTFAAAGLSIVYKSIYVVFL